MVDMVSADGTLYGERALADAEALAAMLDNTPECLAYLDTDFVFRYVNAAYVAQCGVPRDELLGRGHFEHFPNADNEALFRMVVETGEPVEYVARPFEFEHQPWRGVTYWDWTLRPVVRDGRVAGLILSLKDVTERTQRARLSEGLLELESLVHSTLDPDTILASLIDRAPAVAGCDSVGIALRRGNRWFVPHTAELLKESAEGSYLSPEEIPVAEMTAKRREAIVIDDVSTDPVVAESLERFDIKSILNVPLFVRDEVVGVLGLHFHGEPRSFDPAVVEFAERLASSVSLALENARLYEVEHTIAETLQGAIVSLPERIPGIEFGSIYVSGSDEARVGGDFYDVFEMRDGVVGITIGDVAGKGLGAAVTTAFVRDTVRALATEKGTAPGDVLAAANEVVYRATPPEAFATVFFGALSLADGALKYASAGHATGMACCAGSCEMLQATSALLGAFEGVSFTEREVDLPESGVILLCTDGLTEARRDGEMFGEARVAEIVASMDDAPPQQLAEKLMDMLLDFTQGDLSDDVALLAIRRKSSG
jgi:PAS domain S-box-containing protein